MTPLRVKQVITNKIAGGEVLGALNWDARIQTKRNRGDVFTIPANGYVYIYDIDGRRGNHRVTIDEHVTLKTSYGTYNIAEHHHSESYSGDITIWNECWYNFIPVLKDQSIWGEAICTVVFIPSV